MKHMRQDEMPRYPDFPACLRVEARNDLLELGILKTGEDLSGERVSTGAIISHLSGQQSQDSCRFQPECHCT